MISQFPLSAPTDQTPPSRFTVLINSLTLPFEPGIYSEFFRGIRLRWVCWRMAALALLAMVFYAPSIVAIVNRGDAPNAAIASPAFPELRFSELFPTPSHLRWQGASNSLLPKFLLHVEGLAGKSTLAQRTVGLAIHWTTAVLLWLILRRMGMPAAWLVTAGFLLHPAAVATIIRLDQHDRLWAALFAVTGFLLLLRVMPDGSSLRAAKVEQNPTRTQDRAGWEDEHRSTVDRLRASLSAAFMYIGALIALGAATMGQPTVALAFAPIFPMLLLWKRNISRNNIWKCFLVLSPLILLSGVILYSGATGGSLAVRSGAAADSQYLAPALSSAAAHFLWAVGWSARWAIIPLPISGPEIETRAVSNLYCVLGILVLLGTATLLLLKKHRAGGFTIAACTFCLLVPTIFAPSTVHSSAGEWIAGGDGSTYLASIPVLCVIVAAAAMWIARRPRIETSVALLSFGAIVICSLGTITAVRAGLFVSPESTLRSALTAEPNSPSARGRLAELLLKEGKSNEAMRVLGNIDFNQCTDATEALAEGDLLQNTSRPGASTLWYELAEKLDPTDAAALAHLASADLAMGQTRDAVAVYQRDVDAHPQNVDLRNEFGLVLTALHDYDDAAIQFQKAIDASPDFVSAHVNYATVLIQQQKLKEAADQLQTAVKLDPENADAFHNAGVVLSALQDNEQAERLLFAAVQLRPSWPEGHNDLGVALSKEGKFKRAEFEFQRAISLRPNYPDAEKNLQITQRHASAVDATKPSVE